jgi:hypothetical protein
MCFVVSSVIALAMAPPQAVVAAINSFNVMELVFELESLIDISPMVVLKRNQKNKNN